jgi:actin-like ATPase involved in cell morphogenesis
LSYRLGVDLGTTFTAAASVTDGDPPIMVGLGNRSLQIPSVLFMQADGNTLVGEPAERRGLEDPSGVVREFKRRLGDPIPILVAGASYSAESLTARLLRWVVSTAAERMGGPAESVMITYPANWGPFKLGLLGQAAAMAGIDHELRCTEPEAAAAQYAAHAQVAVGDRLAVYDLGGGTFDVCVLEKTDRGFVLLGSPGGLEHLGGVDFDEAVFRHVLASVDQRVELDPEDPSVDVALGRLRRECVDAKEALSSDTDVAVPVALPGLTTTVRMTRTELEAMIRPAVLESVAAIRRTMKSASVEPGDLSTIILVGGSSRIPMVGEILQTTLGVRTALDLHPKHDVALGAARAAQQMGGDAGGEKLLASPRPLKKRKTRTRRPPRGTAPMTPAPLGANRSAVAEAVEAPSEPVEGSAEAVPPDASETEGARAEPSESEAAGPESSERRAVREESSQTEQTPDRPPAAAGWDRRRVGLIVAAIAVLIALVVLGVRGVLFDRYATSAGPTPTAGPPATAIATPTPRPTAARESFDEGSYTWASGVSMTMSIRRVERWGVRYPYCPDGSCGFAEPEDVRVVMAYKVRAPEGLRKSLDASACPGKLQGSDPATTIRLVSNAYGRPIEKPVKAGTTKFGLIEYSIPNKFRKANFEIRSRCGDVGDTGEVAIFGGKFPAPRKAEVPFDAGDKPIKVEDFALRVAEVRTDLDDRMYAVLVERCVRKKLPASYRANSSPLSPWTLYTDQGAVAPESRWNDLLPRYPYGSDRKGGCWSGWLAFDIGPRAKIDSLVHQDPVLGNPASWKLGKGVRPEPTPTPTFTPTRRPTSGPPDPGPSESQEPTEPGSPEPTKSSKPFPTPSPT